MVRIVDNILGDNLFEPVLTENRFFEAVAGEERTRGDTVGVETVLEESEERFVLTLSIKNFSTEDGSKTDRSGAIVVEFNFDKSELIFLVSFLSFSL